jgi:uncharacterized membrane protein HdeD (DUF308 family)
MVPGGPAALFWPGITIGVLALVVGVALIVTGVTDVIAGIRGSTDERVAAVIGGLAGVIFGVLALVWPDITVLRTSACSGHHRAPDITVLRTSPCW